MTHANNRIKRPSRMIGGMAAAAMAVAAPLLIATPAWAHVTVHPTTLPARSSDFELTFRVPNERDGSSTVGLQVFFPNDLPVLSVAVLPVAGWTAKVNSRRLATAISTDDGNVSQVVSDITWTATAGGIAPGQYENFVVAAGRGPSRSGSAIFKTLQTYSSGEVVRWIQIASSSDPSPVTPAPVLTVTPADVSGAPVGPSTSSSSSAESVAGVALAVSLVALGGVVFLIVRKREPSGSVPVPAERVGTAQRQVDR